MKLRGVIAALFCVTLATPVCAQPSIVDESEGCLLETRNDRWTPAGMPEMRRVAGDSRRGSPQIKHAGRIGDVAAFVTDFRCDYIAYEVFLVGSEADYPSLLSALKRIEQGAGFSNLGRLSGADLRTLAEKEKFSWGAGKDFEESGEIELEYTDFAVRLRALYVDRRN